MKYVDFTHTIKEEMPVYPGTEKPKLSLANTLEKDGFRETVLNMYSHTGTHTDAAAHLFTDGKSLDKYEASRFCTSAVMLDCRDMEENSRISADMLKALGDKFQRADFLIIRTGWEKYYCDEKYFSGFPCLDREAAEYIVKCGKKGVGVDAISVDPTGAPLEIHKILLSGGCIIVENLCNLDLPEADEFEFFAFPLKFENADGAPTRAVGIVR